MNSIWIGLLTTLLSTNQTQVLPTLLSDTNLLASVPLPTDPVELEYRLLLHEDDAAATEIDQWILTNHPASDSDTTAANSTPPLSDEELNQKILSRLQLVRTKYETFLEKHPDHSKAHLAFASFLSDIGEDDTSLRHMEIARTLSPSDPAIHNNIANHLGHSGNPSKAFESYLKAIDLNPNEALYHHNLGNLAYLYRKDAMQYFQTDEQGVFDLVLKHYNQAIQLKPDDFSLATDIAQTYYGIQPLRAREAMQAWNHALAIASDETEQQGAHIHLARIKTRLGLFEEAQHHLDQVQLDLYQTLKERLQRNLNESKSSLKEQAPTAL